MTESMFPPPDQTDEEGILGYTFDLNTEMLADAYSHGIFPWPYEEKTVLWFSPPKRSVLFFDHLHVPSRLKRFFRNHPFTLKISERFDEVIEHCANVPRKGQDGTWITGKIKTAYREFHRLGFAHSFEAYGENGELAGGMYGISLGGIFCGESMFHLQTGASKFALLSAVATLKNCGLDMLDTQVLTPLLARFGAQEIDRSDFQTELKQRVGNPLTAEFLRSRAKTPESLI